jgi:hypothetical protein
MKKSLQDRTCAQPSHCRIIDIILCFSFFQKVLELAVGQIVASNVDQCLNNNLHFILLGEYLDLRGMK